MARRATEVGAKSDRGFRPSHSDSGRHAASPLRWIVTAGITVGGAEAPTAPRADATRTAPAGTGTPPASPAPRPRAAAPAARCRSTNTYRGAPTGSPAPRTARGTA